VKNSDVTQESKRCDELRDRTKMKLHRELYEAVQEGNGRDFVTICRVEEGSVEFCCSCVIHRVLVFQLQLLLHCFPAQFDSAHWAAVDGVFATIDYTRDPRAGKADEQQHDNDDPTDGAEFACNRCQHSVVAVRALDLYWILTELLILHDDQRLCLSHRHNLWRWRLVLLLLLLLLRVVHRRAITRLVAAIGRRLLLVVELLVVAAALGLVVGVVRRLCHHLRGCDASGGSKNGWACGWLANGVAKNTSYFA